MVDVKYLDPRATEDQVGEIPKWLSEHDLRPAKEQFDTAYLHGGGWHPFKGFRLTASNYLEYPGDPRLAPIALMRLRDELILIYEHAWVCIIQPDHSFEVCRMD